MNVYISQTMSIVIIVTKNQKKNSRVNSVRVEKLYTSSKYFFNKYGQIFHLINICGIHKIPKL